MNKRKHKKSLDRAISRRERELGDLVRPIVRQIPYKVVPIKAVQEFDSMTNIPERYMERVLMDLLAKHLEQYVEFHQEQCGYPYHDMTRVIASISIAMAGSTTEYERRESEWKF